MGRPLADRPALRELVIGFGDSGYIALYRHDVELDAVFVLDFRHQKESGY
ncbi:MAG: type II toxin-antitoxin system RelE/ParE family toxin [Gammaproteobacteria bacterium]|nr:type II toxin-antitoxin system RelE/ParE family toxin [Gammaproteobacteria bacterium]